LPLSKIRYLDGTRLRNAVIASIVHLEQHLDYLNKINVFHDVVPRYDRVLSIHLPRVISGTFQAVENAAREFEKGKIICIDGKNISGALGLVVMEVAAELVKRFNIGEEILIVEAAPALGVHVGPGTIGFAFIGYK